jgi:hypothetical protein
MELQKASWKIWRRFYSTITKSDQRQKQAKWYPKVLLYTVCKALFLQKPKSNPNPLTPSQGPYIHTCCSALLPAGCKFTFVGVVAVLTVSPFAPFSFKVLSVFLLLKLLTELVLDFAILKNPCLRPSWPLCLSLSSLSSAPISNQRKCLLVAFHASIPSTNTKTAPNERAHSQVIRTCLKTLVFRPGM